MRGKILLFAMCIAVLLTGCYSVYDPEPSATASPYPEAYAYVEELTAYSDVGKLNWNEILDMIPSDSYEEYPGQPAVPLSATLYKNGEAQELDVNDPRLAKLMNFYHNMVYNEVYSYTQGSFSPAEYEAMEQSDFRLELTYEPCGSGEKSFDKVLIAQNTFVGVRSEVPFGDYPFSSFGRYPLYVESIDWLELFGF